MNNIASSWKWISVKLLDIYIRTKYTISITTAMKNILPLQLVFYCHLLSLMSTLIRQMCNKWPILA